ncbi:hypothetical protein KIW84_064741 [Lathyrus oleraceus]|uniref:Uncharacterized protein n=1 Tax=Pisum sativum TaxID=3888 RepID=A0A9D4WDJ0_PEA|nr:hypothetical protein KIW84_064741 [Pisum sativum]
MLHSNLTHQPTKPERCLKFWIGTVGYRRVVALCPPLLPLAVSLVPRPAQQDTTINNDSLHHRVVQPSSPFSAATPTGQSDHITDDSSNTVPPPLHAESEPAATTSNTQHITHVNEYASSPINTAALDCNIPIPSQTNPPSVSTVSNTHGMLTRVGKRISWKAYTRSTSRPTFSQHASKDDGRYGSKHYSAGLAELVFGRKKCGFGNLLAVFDWEFLHLLQLQHLSSTNFLGQLKAIFITSSNFKHFKMHKPLLAKELAGKPIQEAPQDQTFPNTPQKTMEGMGRRLQHLKGLRTIFDTEATGLEEERELRDIIMILWGIPFHRPALIHVQLMHAGLAVVHTLHIFLLTLLQRQQEELRVATDQISQQKTDFLDRTQQDIGDLIEQMDEVRLELTDMRQIV